MDAVGGWKGGRGETEKVGERTVMVIVETTQFEKPCSGK